jgi:hypothetical protein
MPRDLLEIKPSVLAEARASCGCTFVCCLEQAFDLRECRWRDKMTMVVVPCRDEHIEIAREVAENAKLHPGNIRTVAGVAELMSERIAA